MSVPTTCLTDNSFQVLVKTVYTCMNELCGHTSLLAAHVVIKERNSRLRNLSRILASNENIAESLIGLKHDLMMQDVLALQEGVKQLKPQPHEIDGTGRVEWRDRADKFTSHILHVQADRDQLPEQCIKILNSSLLTWNKVKVYMFLYDYILPQGKSTDSYSMSRMELLWKSLKEEPDFTKLETIKNLEKLLETRNNIYTKKLFGSRKCCNCKKDLTSPVLLKCSHELCGSCYEKLKDSVVTCMADKCEEQVLADDGTASDLVRQRHLRYNKFQSALNKFYLEVLSSLCFAGHLPEEKLVRHLVEVVVYRKRKEGDRHVLHGCIDPTPVLRSFVLQQLLACSHQNDKVIYDMLSDAYTNMCQEFAGDDSDKIQLMLLILFCIEDSQISAFMDRATKHVIANLAMEKEGNRQITIRIQQAQFAAESIRQEDKTDIDSFRTVALRRLILSTAADAFVQSQQVEMLFETVKNLCSNTNEKYYLMRCVIKRHGFGALQELTSNSKFSWILPDGIEKLDCSPDLFLSRGSTYLEIRNALEKALIDEENLDHLVTIVQEGSKKDKAIDFVLSVYRLITTDYRIKPPNQQTLEALQRVQDRLTAHINGGNIWTAIKQLSSNTQPTPPLSPGTDVKNCILQDITVHCWQLLELLPGGGEFRLLQPFIMLKLAPSQLEGCFLPTMPGSYDPIFEFLRSVDQLGDMAGTKTYVCANGHPYLIGECGRAWRKGKCAECGAEIGGRMHKLTEGNAALDAGHVLGEKFLESTEPERQLTPLSLRIIRLILHTTMFISSKHDPKGMEKLIDPKPNNVGDFLWRHMRNDLTALIKLTDRSCDDVAILVHSILIKFWEPQKSGVDCSLQSKKSRETWETEFMNTYISPVTQNIERLLTDTNKMISNDTKMGTDALLELLNKAEETLEVPEDVRQCAALWSYRIAPDMTSLQYELTEQNTGGTRESALLKTFLSLHPILQHMHLLPSIIQLLLTLRTMYRGRLSHSEAARLTVMNFTHKATDEKQVRVQIENLRTLLKELDQYIVKRRPDLADVEWELNADTPLCDILPEKSGSGRRVWVMLEVLVGAHNSMLQAFCDSNKIKFNDLVELSISDLVPSHLIAYNTDEKLLPLIRAHARYELQQGQRTQQSFELTSLTQHLQSWLFVARPRIKTRPLIEPIASTYTTSSTLLKLEENIAQVKLNPGEARIILEQCNRLDEVTASLRTLDTALGFLTVVHRDPTNPLSTFLKDDIKLEVEFVSQKAMDVCELQHVRDLWFILALRKAVMLTNKEQDGLEWLSQEDRVPLDDDELLERTRDILRRCGRDMLLPLMLRCVVFHTTQNELNYPLRDMLWGVGDDQEMLVPDALMELPEDLKTNQIADVFREAVQQCQAQN